jgi:V/A-type H+-transporting ATPase subunit I
MRHYFVTFSKSKLHLDNCLEEKIEKDLIQIESEIEYLKKHSVELLSKIKSFSSVKNDIYKAYIAALDRYNFEKAYYSSVEALGDVFVYQGWVPEKELSVLEKSVSSDPVSISSVEPEPDEVPPTFIKNKKFSGVGQELVEFYDTPSYKDWDPSSFVFLSFIIFFAMIMGDGGYGIVLFLVTLYAAIKVKKPGVKAKRMLAMAFILSIATIGYGVMTGSFFSVTESNPVFGKLLQFKLFNSGSVDKETLDNTMRVSIIIGMIHISLSLFLKTLRLIFSEKSFIVPLSNIAWIVAIWTYFFFYGNSFAGIESGQDIQKYILYCCGGVVFLTSSGSLNPLKIFAGGLLGLYNGVQFFSDILSYLRIFALGLSGALIAQTFNGIASSMSDMGSFYIVLAVIVSILGHLLNLGLSIMSAVIHGLRLNYLEYYRWSFDGGGKPYKPLKSLLEQ